MASLYDVLGVSRTAKMSEIRQAYRSRATKEHPDKGGDQVKFMAVQKAYDVLVDDNKRRMYDATGQVERSAEEDLLDAFGGGTFKENMRAAEAERANQNESITLAETKDMQSHTYLFEAWTRARGEGKVYDREAVIEDYGVEKSSYEAKPLPKIKAYQVRCNKLGNPAESTEVISEPLPPALEFGEVLVSIRMAPINPADLYNIKAGATPSTSDAEPLKVPFIGGNDCVGVVMSVGEGVKHLKENDVVMPMKTGMGTWRSLAVWKEKDLRKLPSAEELPYEYAAMLREMCVAFRLLHDFGTLKPGDGVILNAANSTVGTCVIQLCRCLKLRPIAVVRDPGTKEDMDKLVARLKALGAAEVLVDGGSIKAKLEENKFFAKPRLALDAVGGPSAVALADALQDGCPVVIYGCMSGKAPVFSWPQWVFKDLQVRGFNLHKWMTVPKGVSNSKAQEERKAEEIKRMFTLLAQLVAGDKLSLDYTEYELGVDFAEALEHSQTTGRNTKVLLKIDDIGTDYA